ncbi:MAG: DNA-3-methyladenine glycosylase [Candidatus Taylorbacteria bacterium]|nr:DNA-3-methyladenine glycosylase [Candidatus Taylorbacteria bacterium]
MALKLKAKTRCAWAGPDEIYIDYHDFEWGIPVHDDRQLFEMLNLEGAQAGLSWITILKKRGNYRKAFDNFNAEKIAKYTQSKQALLMKNAGIVRNRLKINAIVENAKAFLRIRQEFGSFDAYIWSFISGKTVPHAKRAAAIRASELMSKDLKKRGFRFVGPTICFAFMQAVGMVNDHAADCFRAQ